MAEDTSVLVYGAGGHEPVVLDAALRQPGLRVIGRRGEAIHHIGGRGPAVGGQ